MTLESQTTKAVYDPDGEATVFPVPFPLFSGDDLRCLAVDADGRTEELTGFGVSGAGPAGATVVFSSPPPAGKKLALLRRTRRTQESDWPEAGRFPAKTAERGFDRLTAMVQELDETLERAIKVDPSRDAAPAAEEFYGLLAGHAADARAAAQSAEMCRDAACDAAGRALEARDQAAAVLPALHNAAQDEIAGVILEGDRQVNRVKAEGTTQIGRARDEAEAARAAAGEAAESARLAQNVAGIGVAGRNNWGLVRIGDGVEVDADGTISVHVAALVSAPSVSFPEIVGVGAPVEAVMSAESAVPGVGISHFQATFADQPPVDVPATENRAGALFTPAGPDGSVAVLAVTAVDERDNRSLVTRKSFIQREVLLSAPGILVPQTGAVGVGPAVAFQWQAPEISGPPGTAVSTEFQVARDEAFTDIFYQSPEDWPATTGVTLTLPTGETLWARARHVFALYGPTDWGPAATFETLSAFLDAPVIASPTAGQQGVSLTPAIVIAEPVLAGQTVQYRQTQIASDSAFSTTVWDSGQAAYAQSQTAGTLAKNAAYYARTRLCGSLTGWTDWSATVGFATQAAAVNDQWTYSASTTFTVPATGAYALEAAGGGGGGARTTGAASYSRGGGAGGYAKSVNIALNKGASLSLTVGGGGAGASQYFSSSDDAYASSYIQGGGGGASSVGAYLSAGGGAGGRINWSMGNFSTAGGGAGAGSGGNNVNQTGGGGAGGGAGAAGSAGWCRITFTG